MTFAERLKTYRTQSGISQEKLAEKIGVSRQAITKWETDRGMPDIENLTAIARLFGVTLDRLVTGEKTVQNSNDFIYESRTEYDISGKKRYDIKIGSAKQIGISAHDGEKLTVRLASDLIYDLQRDLKIRIDDIRGRLDVNLLLSGDMTKTRCKEDLSVFIGIPRKYVSDIELAANCGELKIGSLECENLEFDGKADAVIINGFSGELELNCNTDLSIDCRSFKGAVGINQINSVSKIILPEVIEFSAVKKGIGNAVFFERNGSTCEPFDKEDAQNIIELNGMKSELYIIKG